MLCCLLTANITNEHAKPECGDQESPDKDRAKFSRSKDCAGEPVAFPEITGEKANKVGVAENTLINMGGSQAGVHGDAAGRSGAGAMG